jgi:hypothetical protein
VIGCFPPLVLFYHNKIMRKEKLQAGTWLAWSPLLFTYRLFQAQGALRKKTAVTIAQAAIQANNKTVQAIMVVTVIAREVRYSGNLFWVGS